MLWGDCMAFWEDNANVTATVPMAVKMELERRAGLAGLSLSRYASELLQQQTPADYDAPDVYCRPVRLHSGSFETTIPHEIIDGLSIRNRQPLAWCLGRGGALVRPVES